MNKLKLLLLTCCFFTTTIYSQISQIKIVSFQVKNVLPAKIDDWTSIPAALILTAQKNPGTQTKEPKLVVQIKSGGAIVCGTNVATAQIISPFDVKTFTTNELTGSLANCKELKEGSYQLCVQFYNLDRIAISNEVCKEFRVESPKQEEYAPPTLINPENGKTFTADEMKKPLQFRWTPIVPKPKEPVTYRLKVWQLMQGQNATAAMRSNTPLIEKDVKEITQAIISNIYTGPCRPPYLCDFVWQVQALNRDGKPMGNNNGLSEAWNFSVSNTDEVNPPILQSPENGKTLKEDDAKNPMAFRWTPIRPKPQEPVTYRLKVWQLMQGQNSQIAMRSNKPIVEKDVKDATQTEVAYIYTGPCRPPYLCDFVWQVQALDKQGNPLGSNNGMSEVFAFSVAGQYIIQIDSIKVKCTQQAGIYSFDYWITNPNPGTAVFSLLAITSSTPAGATLGSFTPPIGTTIPSGGQIHVVGTINAAINLSNICIGARINDQANPFNQAQKDTCINVEPCICKDCDSASLNVTSPSVTVTNAANGIYTATGNINVTGISTIYAVEMQVLSYSYTATPASCSNGVSSIENSGVIHSTGTTINGSSVNMINETISGLPGSNNGVAKNIKFISATPLPSTIPFNVNFGLPTPLLGLGNDCCKMNYTICLRIKIFYDKEKCNSCAFTYCFPAFTN